MVLVAAADRLITYFQAMVIGLLQGITELFPISSLGHAVILPKLLGWDLSQHKPYFLAFLVAFLGGGLYYFEIMLPGSIVGLIVGYATQKYGSEPNATLART